MRILFFSYVSNQTSGVGNRVYYLSRELAKLNHEVIVLTKNGEYIENLNNLSILYGSRKYPNIPPVPIFNVAIFQIEAYKLLKQISNGVDLIDFQHVHFSPIINFLNENIVSKSLLTMHGTEIGLSKIKEKRSFLSINLSIFEKNSISKIKKIIAITNFVKKEISEYYGFPSNRIEVIPNGIDCDEFKNLKSLGLKEKYGITNLILTLGGFSIRKGTHILIQALSKINVKDWYLAIAGPSNKITKKNIYKMIEDLEIRKDRIIEIPFLSRKKLLSLLNEADIFIHPAIYEPQGIAVLEAMAAGKAIIASKVGGLPEILGDAGILIQPDLKELKEAIELFLQNKDLRNKYGFLAKERARIFDWKNIAKEYEKRILNNN